MKKSDEAISGGQFVIIIVDWQIKELTGNEIKIKWHLIL
jgi:hypothetical protein